MTDEDELPEGWTRWHAREGVALTLTFRPDVFDGQRFPPECLPMISVKRPRVRGPRGRPAASGDPDRGYAVAFRLEPEVVVAQDAVETWAAGVARAIELAGAFSSGSLGFRDAYQLPRDRYLDALDALIAGDAPDE